MGEMLVQTRSLQVFQVTTVFGGDEGDALTGNNGNDTFTGGLLVDTIAAGGVLTQLFSQMV